MAAVTFGQMWLAPATDLTAARGFRLATLAMSPQQGGEVRQYGNSRLRAVSTTTKARQAAVTLRLDTRDDVTTIEDWQGVELYVRDPKGRAYFAVYYDPQITERAGLDSATVTLTFNEITGTIAV